MDGDICIDSHARLPLQRNAASEILSALYNDNLAHVGTGLDARPQARTQSWTNVEDNTELLKISDFTCFNSFWYNTYYLQYLLGCNYCNFV